MKWKATGLLSVLLVTSMTTYSQTDKKQKSEDDLMAMLEQEDGSGKHHSSYTTATFKTTRIANGHSIENTAKGVLDFRISHRFGPINGGPEEFFGLDGATTRLGLDYGVTDWLMVGVGRSSYFKEFDGFVKAKILRQTDDNRMPVSVSYVGAASAQTNEVVMPAGQDYLFSNRLAYVNQILIARKFSNAFSLQLTPTHLHYNLVDYKNEPNNVLALGVGGRLKLTNRISLTGEYFYQLPDNQLRNTRNALTLGFDIETGGHVFQLFFSNATGITERNAIGKTTGRWDKGDVHFGFNISRVFTIVRPKEFQGSRNKIW